MLCNIYVNMEHEFICKQQTYGFQKCFYGTKQD